jgi:hypothetical protein
MGSPLDGLLVVDVASGVAARQAAGVPAPCFGQHNRFVLSESPGLDDAAIAELHAAGTVADQPAQGSEAS